ncbi:MAG: GNAT family N-acetyltransferase [Flaviramulus sp.]|nr:GNAT family N-acetyltransferase [Flaviramulus sp.]NNC49767.1 GNAT family N-acetyltransferase [Flaviramulus sp.]
MPFESCVFDSDDATHTIHLGIYISEELIGVCSFFKNNFIKIPVENQYQLRGMAVLSEFQNKGFGKVLLSESESLLKNKNTNLIWCNAREIAVNFYKQNGYKVIGDPFIIKEIGLHYVMFKTIA